MIFSRAKGQKRGFIFTERTQSERGVFSVVLASLSLVAGILLIHNAYKMGGQASENAGAVGFLSIVFSLIGLCVSIISIKEPDSFKLFPIVGLILSIVSLVFWSFILYLGVV